MFYPTVFLHPVLPIYAHVLCRSCTILFFYANSFCCTFKCRYAIRDGNKIKIFKNFKERKSFKPEYGAEGKYFHIYFDHSSLLCLLLPLLCSQRYMSLMLNAFLCVRHLWWPSPWCEICQWTGFLRLGEHRSCP